MAESKKTTPDVETPETSKTEAKGGTTDKVEVKTFTQDQVNDLIGKTRQEVREQLKEEVEKARKEGEELAKLTAEEREQELNRKHQEENKEWERTLAKRENRLEVYDRFAKADVDIDLIDFVIDEDKEKTLTKAEDFIEKFQKSVQQAVENKLKGKAPKDVSDNSKATTQKVVTSF